MNTVRVTLLNGDVIDKKLSVNVDIAVMDFVTKGVREMRGDCLVVYPALMVEKVEVFNEGCDAPKLRAKRKERAAGAFGKRKRVPVRRATDKDEGREPDS